MGFNKRFLPELSELKKCRERFETDEDFVKYISGKADALLGPSDSMEYFSSLAEKVLAQRKLDGDRREKHI